MACRPPCLEVGARAYSSAAGAAVRAAAPAAAGGAGCSPGRCSQHAAARAGATSTSGGSSVRQRLERVRAARVEAAAGRRPRRVGHLARQRLGQRARAVGVRHGGDQRLGVRMQRQRPERAASAPVSTIRPRYMTATTSATWRTIARSCEISSRPSSSSRASVDEQVRDLRLRRRVERGERLVEHDHRRVGGERARDRDALPLAAARTRAGSARRRPPGGRPARAAPRPAAPRCARGTRPSTSSASASCAPTCRRGLSDENGFWKTICSRAELARPRAARRAARTSRPSKRTVPRPARPCPTAARASVDFPQPDSPTSPTICAALDREARAGDGAHAVTAAPLVLDHDVLELERGAHCGRERVDVAGEPAAVHRRRAAGRPRAQIVDRVRAARVERAAGRDLRAARAARPGSRRAACRARLGVRQRVEQRRACTDGAAAASTSSRAPDSTTRPA